MSDIRGFVLPAVLVLLLLFSAASIGLIYMTNTSISVSGTDLDNTKAYYGAEGAMEKMMSDLSTLFSGNQAPSASDIQSLASSAPDLPGISYSQYTYDLPSEEGVPTSEIRHISAGPNEGLMAQIVPMTLRVTAQGPGGGEVMMSRDIEVALIPVFQFGMFSDAELSYYPGPNFDFGGRVHSNGDLFLATSSSLLFHSKVSTAGEVIRAELANGASTSPGREGPILIPTATGGCDGGKPACRDLQENEGSKVQGPDSADNSNWYNLSTSIYNGMVINHDSGAKTLEMPFVSDGVGPIEVIKRPQSGESSASAVGKSRFYNQAQIRVLISDTSAELPGGAIRLANESPYFEGGAFGGTDTAFAEGDTGVDSDFVRPPGVPAGSPWPLIDGYIVVESRLIGGGSVNVTAEWLNLGIARENPDAILRFQTLKDDDGDGAPDYSPTSSNMRDPSKFLPINLYDAREGEVRDNSLGSGNTTGAVGGIMNVVELDVGNLKRWLGGAIGTTGTQTESVSRNGYILYFSDRRGGVAGPSGMDGSYGFEDMINPGDPNGLPNNTLDEAEDVNGSTTLETQGATNIGDAFGVLNGNPTLRVNLQTVGRKNKVSGARHGIKLVNGGLGQLPTKPDGNGGFTVASENPVYVQGNYNASSAGFGTADGHADASIVADSVTLLSGSWQDWTSFRHPTYLGSSTKRKASNTWYRMAVAAGKGISFDRPAWGSTEYGLDGGTHNFLRYLERWSGRTLHYKGSLVSLFYSDYAVGIYKCCKTVYKPPTRDYSFDTEFLDPTNLPPGTPMFRDIVNLGFRQIFTTQ